MNHQSKNPFNVHNYHTMETPSYLYSKDILQNAIERFSKIKYPNKKIFAATMANNNKDILRILRENNINVFVNSEMHLEKVLECGFLKDQIIYTSTAIKKATMQRLISNEILVNIDSLSQLELFGQLNEGGKVGIRLNVAEFFLGNVSESVNNRIGINEKEFDRMYEIAAKYDLAINGLHVYLGTDILDFSYMSKSILKTIEVSKRITDLEYIDFGGGFPVQGMYGEYFDYEQYDDFITREMNSLSDHFKRSIELIIEPGRSLFGESAVFLTEVLDIKEREDRFIICCDSSVSVFPRSLFYGEYHEVVPVVDTEKTFNKTVDIVGQTTYSRDYLATGLENFKEVKIGDRLCFLYAGSYCYSMITQFLGQKKPNEWMIMENDQLKLINDTLSKEEYAQSFA